MLQDFTSLCDDFAFLDTADERYQHLLDLGRQLPPMPEPYCTDDYLVQGCLSRVWLHYTPQQSQRFIAQSDAIVVRGLLYVLLSAAEHCTDWTTFNAGDVLKSIGLEGFISTQRAGGLAAAAQKMRAYALNAVA